jgi:putative oxidoreductase
MARLKIIGLWILQVLLAVVMIGPGWQKFTSPVWERMFRVWGYPEHFYLVIGGIEVAGGLCLLVPRLAAYGAAVLVPVMLGAAFTQILRGGRSGVGEFVFAALLAIVAWVRWRGMRRQMPVERAPAAAL